MRQETRQLVKELLDLDLDESLAASRKLGEGLKLRLQMRDLATAVELEEGDRIYYNRSDSKKLAENEQGVVKAVKKNGKVVVKFDDRPNVSWTCPAGHVSKVGA